MASKRHENNQPRVLEMLPLDTTTQGRPVLVVVPERFARVSQCEMGG